MVTYLKDDSARLRSAHVHEDTQTPARPVLPSTESPWIPLHPGWDTEGSKGLCCCQCCCPMDGSKDPRMSQHFQHSG